MDDCGNHPAHAARLGGQGRPTAARPGGRILTGRSTPVPAARAAHRRPLVSSFGAHLEYEKLVGDKLNLQVNEQAYLMGIAKHLWIKKYNRDSRNIDINEAGQLIEHVEEPLPVTRKLLNFLETAGQRCMDMLKAFYYDKLNMIEVAEQFGYSGERSATVQKYKCLEKVRDTVKQKALTYEDFLE